MGDQRPGKFSKLGKLLGVSSTSISSQNNTNNNQKEAKENGKSASSSSSSKNNSEEFILPQVENDNVSPLQYIKQPQPYTTSNTQLNPNTTSPKLTSTRSHSPINGISSTTTSPISVASLDQKLKRQQSSNITVISPPQPAVLIDSKSSSSVNTPAVSRQTSRKQKSSIKSESSQQNIPPSLPRFLMLENGDHEHHLRSAKRQEKLSNMLKDLLGAKKLRDEAKSAVPDILQKQPIQQQQVNGKPPTLFAGLVNHVKNNTSPYHQPGTTDVVTAQDVTGPDCRSFVEKYGRCQEVIGRGSFGVVRISHKRLDSTTSNEKLYAVKEFKRKPSENEKKYNRRLTSEFCISSSLKHINIIDTLDLLKDAKGDYCEVMEFCSGGDLYTLIIASGKLEYAEADCFFKQLIKGVNYMHDMGVAHRDLKPENLLLTQDGVLKITDFGNSECFKMAWENEIQYSEGICGSSPYIAPEEFTQVTFDPRCVDIWSCGVIYMAMRTGRQLWKLADPKKDEFFDEYLIKRKDAKGYEPIESLKRARCRNVIYSILDPVAERRITGKQILNSEWGREINCCIDNK
ncbi:unnamed protein product [Candida verbasci]|uniref:non-specific serine/threonine protein kinase n=1 Tax=Candida verbasci TaxID=1227364 RepID=A0A9W4TPG2_9ASCO|nr:unnamed protein product [Candida verbasci]